MGAEFNMGRLKGTPDEVSKRFEQAQEQDRYDNGHSYSGGWGMCTGLTFTRETFATDAEAENWLVDHAEKWGPALAVKVGDNWVIGAWCSS